MNTQLSRQRIYELGAASLLLGGLGDGLLRLGPWGINLLLWTVALLATATTLALRQGNAWDRRVIWVGFGTLLAAGGIVWRDAIALKFLDFLTINVLLVFLITRAAGRPVLIGELADHAWRLARVGLQAAAGFLPLLLDRSWWPRNEAGCATGRVRPVFVGLLIASPLLIVFGALLASADLIFRDVVTRVFDMDLSRIVSHLIPIAFISWIVAGWLLALLLRVNHGEKPFAIPQFIELGVVEIGIALGLLNLLFLTFIGIQVRYLFASDQWVQITPGVTYAEYARQGFFQLVLVVALALPMLLAGDWLLGTQSRRGFRWQAGIMLGMLFVILTSAWHRLALYQEAFGWTVLRFYVCAFILWLAVVMAWFLPTVLSGWRQGFLAGPILAAFITMASLHLWNPEDWIVRQNLARMQAGKTFDLAYTAQLSHDATPALLEVLNSLNAADRATLEGRFARRLRTTEDWRTWNWSQRRARQLLLDAGIKPDPAPHHH